MHADIGISNVASGNIKNIYLDKVWASAGVIDVITADDVPGHIDIGPVFKGDPVLAHKEIKFHGQPIFAVLAKTQAMAKVAATLASIEIDTSPAILTVAQAKAALSFVRPSHQMSQGNAAQSLSEAKHTAKGTLSIGGQEHLYLEGQVSMAIPQEEDRMFIYTSSQHPSEVQKLVAEVLDIKLNKVVVDMRRMGGGFGGKETQAAQWACIAALFAARKGCAVKLRLPRQQDMIVTGKRHPFENSFEVGFDDNGKIQAAKIEVNGNCGHSPDLSDAIVDRAMFHADNTYFLEHCQIDGHRLKTHQVSHTAYRGFGGPQGMIMAEAMLDKVARATGKDPLEVRKLNLYSESNGLTTPYGMHIENDLSAEIIEKLEQTSDYWARRARITEFNKNSPIIKKGLA
jgi:xanthine dehydrogenase large subunit